MTKRLLMFVLLCAVPAVASAQSVEMVFTPGVVNQALALKGSLKVDKMNAVSFGTLALVGASRERKKAYADKVSGMTAIVILGEDALKAVSEVEFGVPVIVVNSGGPTAARKRVFRVFDSGSAPSNAVVIQSLGGMPDWIKTNKDKDVSLKGDVSSTVQALLVALK